MTAFFALRGFLSGFKTYLVVGAWFLCLALEKVGGLDVAGFDPGADWLEQAFNYVLVVTGRAGLAKLATPAVLDRILGARK